MTIAFGLQLLGPEADELFLKVFVHHGDPSSLLLSLISLLPHRLDIKLQVLGAFLQDSDLLTSCRLVVVKSVHLVVVHLDVSGQVSHSALVGCHLLS